MNDTLKRCDQCGKLIATRFPIHHCKPATPNKARLTQQFTGADSPDQMGTTGLVSWVLHELPSTHHPRNRWERLQVALRIVKRRGQDQSRFCEAVMATGSMYDIPLYRMFKALEKRGLAHRPLAGDC